MKLTVIGTGYVGLVSGVCWAELGYDVICVDKDAEKIARLKRAEISIHEPGLREMLVRNADAGRLAFATESAQAVQWADIVVLAVGTPPSESGEADLSYIYEAAISVGTAMNGYKAIITKSTVPVGTNEKIKRILKSHTYHGFDVISIPEFLREGSAIKDTLNPDRIVIGTDNERAAALAGKLHESISDNLIYTDFRSAEMIKYASNAFLATKISFINEIANICEKVGADISQVAIGMGQDRRIGPSFLNAGIGYGGSCFPKDTKALIQIAGNVDYEFKLLKSVVDVNNEQRNGVIGKLKEYLGNLRGRTVAIWGLSFKPHTDDVREAPSLDIVAGLVQAGVIVRAYDPVASDNFRRAFDSPRIVWCQDAYSAVEEADAVCLLTEWPEFLDIDLLRVGKRMNSPILIDGRNVLGDKIDQMPHFFYYSVGRPHLNRTPTEDRRESRYASE